MTMQHADLMLVDGQEMPCDSPGFAGVKSRRVRRQLAKLRPWSTALHRGYRAAWEIRDGRLWLVDFDARIGPRWRPVGLSFLFPFGRGRVFAGWVTGSVQVHVGEAVRDGIYGRVWPQTVVYRIERGEIVGHELRGNSAGVERARVRKTIAEVLDDL